MTLTILQVGVPQNAFENAASRNASIADTVTFLGRVRAVQRYDSPTECLATRIGKALKEAGVVPADINKTSRAVLIEDGSDLRTAIVDEAIWHLRVGALQLRHAAQAAVKGHPTLGKTSAYYASYYIVQALCRLAGRIPLHLREYNTNLRPGPTVLVAWDGEGPARRYWISSHILGNRQTHSAMWEVFFHVFQWCPDAQADHLAAVRFQTEAGEESHERNDQTYLPWAAFQEFSNLTALRSAHRDFRLLDEQARDAIHGNTLQALNQLATDPEYGAYARACLRASLAVRFFDGLSQRSKAIASVWSTVREDISNQLAYLGERNMSGVFLESLVG